MNKWEYMLAGRATFTVVSRKTNKRYTFQVKKGAPRGTSKGVHFVRCLYGPDNEHDYRHVANIFERDRLWPARRFQKQPFEAFNWLFHTLKVMNGRGDATQDLPDCDFLPSTKCCRCGRTLTTPESIALGIGPECVTKVAGL